jgi:drug/metabolite transporter (DMT)-like permease
MRKYASLSIVFAAAIWGIDGVFLRPQLQNVRISLVVFLESFIILLILSPLIIKRLRGFKSLEIYDWLSFIGVAFFGGVIGTMAITKALFYVDYVNLSIVVLIQKLQPIFAIMLASLLLKERPPKIFFLWSFFAIIGAYLMTFGLKIPDISNDRKLLEAALYALIATFSFAISTVLGKRALRNVDFEVGTYLRFLIMVVLMIIIVGGMNEFQYVLKINRDQWIVLFVIALMTGGTASFLYYYGLKVVTASVSTICELAFPLTAIILEYILRGHILNGVQWLGVLILFLSILKVIKLPIVEGDSKIISN